MQPDVSVIIPAYNEARTIERAVRETVTAFSRFGKTFEIIVVDDGSRDETAEIVARLASGLPSLRLVRHDSNQGKGAAVRTGVRAAEGETLLFLDADLATHPSQFETFIPHLDEADILIGSRRVAGARISEPQPFYRIVLGRVFNGFIRWYLRIPFKDTQCGFKAFKAEAAKTVFKDMRTRGWAFDVELLVRAMRAGYRIKELPVEWRHGSETRVRLRDAWPILKDVWSLRRR